MTALDDALKAMGSATEPVTVAIGTKKVRVKPPMQWRQSAMRALRSGDFDGWAATSLVNDLKTSTTKAGVERTTGADDSLIWFEADPTNAELIQFLSDYQQAAGIELGK
jgi:hypothetical protein